MCQRCTRTSWRSVSSEINHRPAAAERASRRWITSNQPAAFVVDENQSPRTRSRTVPATATTPGIHHSAIPPRRPSRRWPACRDGRRTCRGRSQPAATDSVGAPTRPAPPSAGHGGACPGSPSFPRPDAASGPRPPRQPRPGSGPPRRAQPPSISTGPAACSLPRAAIGCSWPIAPPRPVGRLAGSTSPATSPIRRSVTAIRNADKLDLASRDRRLNGSFRQPRCAGNTGSGRRIDRIGRGSSIGSPPVLWEPWVVTCAHPARPMRPSGAALPGLSRSPNVSHNDPVPAPRAPRRSNNLLPRRGGRSRRAPIQPSPPTGALH